MNLSMFIKQVDAMTEELDHQQLKLFLHETARILPECDRIGFIKRLEAFIYEEMSESSLIVADKNFEREFKEINQIITKINEGEFVLNAMLNEEYHDCYNNDIDEFYYEDLDKVLDMLEDICRFIHKCVDQEKYNEGAKVGESLVKIKVQAIGDYGDNELSILELTSEKLISVDYRKAVLEILYCAYHAYPMEDIPEVIFNILSNSGLSDFKLENLFQYGSAELNGVNEFLNLLIHHLGSITGRLAEVLIKEAISLKNDPVGSIDLAKAYAGTHPGIFLQLLIEGQDQSLEQLLDLGMNALHLIDSKYLIRNEVALMTAEYASILGKNNVAENCYVEAFRSKSSATDYLRALLHSEDLEKTRENLRRIFKGISVNDNLYMHELHRNSELVENKVTINTISMLEFFDGDFEQVLERRMNMKAALGWSGTFMKQGIALFTLLLFRGEQLQYGGRSMLELVKSYLDFSSRRYEAGIHNKTGKSDNELLMQCILNWKETVSIDDVYAEKVISKLEKIMEKRVTDIMEANRRNYYGECAAFIAALGEVKESRGKHNEKQRYMNLFRKEYSRRRAFKAELERYGYRG
ncbi:hypothetical protein [Fusibacter ferrireducens]|uniref:Ankyrin repeat-containing protein n=1 Tax=Fusibacter ferrireducens TaxID=2785058 RepID=A0ABR9ZW88_9FIRM|nr:hypothetical protein [Fusibacter ferrireducens]MBF4694246.1 hypothetical protein [Fusibacter ferrireducens]